MGSALSSAPTQLIGIKDCLVDFDDGDHTVDLSLRSTRFLKTARTKYKSTLKVAKVFVKQDQGVDLKPYIAEIERISVAVEKNYNVQTFDKAYENDRCGVLIRQYYFSNLYDRLATRPQLNFDEKRWIIFQLFKALHGCHTCQVCHGDIKIDNVLLTSWNWVFLSDFASFKPTHLPVDNPAAFSYFFDTSGRRTCCIAPERFYNPDNLEGADSHICRFDGRLLPAMDIFSLGCVIYELMTEGKPLFNLAGLLAYRKGNVDVEPILEVIEDEGIRSLVRHMININPAKRLSATEYLQQFRGTVFPEVFYTFLHPYMLTFVAGTPLSPDQRIIKLKRDFEKICTTIGKTPDVGSDHSGNLFVLVASLVASCIRSLSTTSAKLIALELLLSLSSRVRDEYKIDRLLPLMIALLGDHVALIRISAVRVLTESVTQVNDIRGSDLNLFPEYIMPILTKIKADSEVLVRAAYAEHISQLAETAQRFLETSQLSIMKASEDTSGLAQQNSNRLSFDKELNILRDMFQAEVVTMMTDTESIVKQTILASNISKLCVFLGPQRTGDVLLSHMLTFFNDKRDWRLRAVFFDNIVGVASYCGSKSLERFILPLMEKCLSDHEEFVVKKTIDAMSSSIELELFPRKLVLSITRDIVPLLNHPSLWIRGSVVALLAIVSKTVSLIDLHCVISPLVKAHLNAPCTKLDNTSLMLNSIANPISRELYNATLSHRDIADLEIMFDALLVRRIQRGETPADSSSLVRPNDVKKHGKLIGYLSKHGLTVQAEGLLLALEFYIKKVWRELRATENDQQQSKPQPFISLRSAGVDIVTAGSPQQQSSMKEAPTGRRNRGGTGTVSEKPTKASRKAMAQLADTPSVHNWVTGVKAPITYFQPDIQRYIQEVNKGKKAFENAEKSTITLKKRQARAAAEARDREYQSKRSWRPEGKMVGHLHEHKKAVNKVVVSPDQKFFASCSDDGSVRIWDCGKLEGKAVTNQSRQQYLKQGHRIRQIEVCEFGQSIAMASDDGTLSLAKVDLSRKSFVQHLKRTMDKDTDGAVVDLKNLGSDSSVLVYATARGQVHGWDLRTDREGWCLRNSASEGLISNMIVDPEQAWLSYGTSRGVYALYDLRYLLPVKSWKDPSNSAIGTLSHFPQCCRDQPCRSSQWDPQSWMISSFGSNEAAIWDMKTSQITSRFYGTQGGPELDLNTLRGPLDQANARDAQDLAKVAPAKSPIQMYDEEVSTSPSTKVAKGLKMQQWPQLRKVDQAPFIKRAERDGERYEDELTATLQGRWTSSATKNVVPGIRAICTTPGTSAAFLGGNDGHIRIWDLERPHESYILGESRPNPGLAARVDLQTTYEVYTQAHTQILKENLGYEARTRTVLNTNSGSGPVAPSNSHGSCITSLAVVTAPEKFLISAGRDGVIKVWR